MRKKFDRNSKVNIKIYPSFKKTCVVIGKKVPYTIPEYKQRKVKNGFSFLIFRLEAEATRLIFDLEEGLFIIINHLFIIANTFYDYYLLLFSNALFVCIIVLHLPIS